MPNPLPVLSVPAPPKKLDDPSFYDRSLLDSWFFRMAVMSIGVAEFGMFAMVSRYWGGLAGSDRAMILVMALLLPALLIREIVEHAKLQDRLAGLNSDDTIKELTKRAARLTYDRFILPSVILMLAIIIFSQAIRNYHSLSNACQGALR
jgi:hypothetical protein